MLHRGENSGCGFADESTGASGNMDEQEAKV